MSKFRFGSNWAAFSEKRLDNNRVQLAIESLRALLLRNTLQDATFLDVGCGSGLFSIAAYYLGAVRVVGIDIDPQCILVCQRNRDRLVPGANIKFQRASVLKPEDLNDLGQFDVVYAWGSLHHTGAMWDGIRNLAKHVLPGGTLVLAVYNKHITSPFWNLIKRLYNYLPSFAQIIMVFFFAPVIYVAKLLVTRRNPIQKKRGMDFWFDIVDWLGGYPYEYATPEEVKTFTECLNFKLYRFVAAEVPTGCNEFVFRYESNPF